MAGFLAQKSSLYLSGHKLHTSPVIAAPGRKPLFLRRLKKETGIRKLSFPFCRAREDTENSPYKVFKSDKGTNAGLSASILWKRLLIDLSSLPRAIGLMAATFGFSALGTIIPQNKSLEYYVENYPAEGSKVLGFLTYDVINKFQMDHIYSAWYFYLTIAWLGASLAACTLTRQWPAVRVAQRWRFQSKPKSVVNQAQKDGVAEVLPNARLQDLGRLLMDRNYQVFIKDSSLYAFKGLAGKLGPIGVHASMLLILAGTAYSGVGGYKGSAMIPEGDQSVVLSNIAPVSSLASLPSASDKVIQVNRFLIDYRPDGSVAQFYSDLSLLDPNLEDDGGQSNELLRKTISVNDPFRYGGITLYQTDWSISSVKLRVLNAGFSGGGEGAAGGAAAEASAPEAQGQGQEDGAQETAASLKIKREEWEAFKARSEVVTLPMANLEGRPGIQGRLWGSYLPTAALDPELFQQGIPPPGVSLLARDPQSVVFYDTRGQFVGVRRPGSKNPIEVNGVKVAVEKVVGATGLELKSDPGVPVVYAGFAGLMVTTLVSYLSHSQVWAVQEGSYVFFAGRSNRARFGFGKEMNQVAEEVPEQLPSERPAA